jgi:hypothetical protein
MNICLSFKKQFAPLVKNKTKRQTIRVEGKRVAEVGDILHLFTGMRTKFCQKIDDVVCIHSERIFIDTVHFWVLSNVEPPVKYSWVESLEIAKKDGFKNLSSFFDFFRQQYGEGIHKMRLYRW